MIAVDDGSRDGTPGLLAGWAAADPRVRTFSTAEGPEGASGLVAALNLGVSAARAPVLARMDADDVAGPTRFASQFEFLECHPDLAGCGAHVELFGETRVGSGYRRYERWLNGIESPREVERGAFVECPVAHPTLMLRASVLRAVGGYRDAGWPEDYDLVLRVLAAGASLANVPGPPLLRWRVREDRHSLTSETYSPAAFRRCRVHFLRETVLPPGRDVVVWGAGKVGKPLARELIAQGTPVASFVDLDARKIGQEIHGAPVLSPPEFESWARLADRPGGRPYVLAAVGSPGVRGDIRGALDAMGLEELTDYRFCA